MGEGSNPVGTAGTVTDSLLNIGTAVYQAQVAKKISDQQAQMAKDANRAAVAQAAAIADQSKAAQNIAAMNVSAMSATTKKWMWIGGAILGVGVLAFVYFKYIRK